VSDYIFPAPASVEVAEQILRELSRRGYLDDDWWCEAENHEPKDRPVNFVAHLIQKWIEDERMREAAQV
jgi:SOS response regulatory protein OraA/RecX